MPPPWGENYQQTIRYTGNEIQEQEPATFPYRSERETGDPWFSFICNSGRVTKVSVNILPKSHRGKVTRSPAIPAMSRPEDVSSFKKPVADIQISRFLPDLKA
jgi:hypothetical protein